MGSFTRLSQRDEDRCVEGGVALLLQRYSPEERERKERRKGFECTAMRSEKPTTAAKFSGLLTRQMQHDLSKLDRHQLTSTVEKMKHVEERPTELGDEKFGQFRGFKSLKIDGTSHVLLFRVDESNRAVVFVRYAHHDVVYNVLPNVGIEFVSFEQFLAGTDLR
ncbi:MAG: hypothetical protein LVQ95_00650 [Candidatus Micrarchaeales archaeon]|nr:hypothetical protein [Candidatus Micrarchaeales archaeon]